jgi:hypothetical protein
MGHCVGGYCPDVIEGKSRIYSLRDSKGEPHVTIEVGKPVPDARRYADLPEDVRDDLFGDATDELRLLDDPKIWNKDGSLSYYGYDKKEEIIENLAQNWIKNNATAADRIVQIKGKGNAKPKDTYLPFVQDFVKSGKWSEVRDFKNTGLIKEGGQMMTPAEHADWLANQLTPPPVGNKRGGKVQFAKSLDAMRHELTKAK